MMLRGTPYYKKKKKTKTNNNCRKQTELEQTEDDANNMR